MFYVGNFILMIGVAGLSETAEDFLYSQYMYSDFSLANYGFGDLLFAAILIALGIVLIAVGWNRKHKIRKFVRYLAIAYTVMGFLAVFSDSEEYYFAISGIIVNLGAMATGILIALYNSRLCESGRISKPRPEPVQPVSEPRPVVEPTVEAPKPKTEIDEIIKTIGIARKTRLATLNPSFKKNLENSAVYLSEMQDEGYKVNPNILEKISNLLHMYLDIEDNKVQTQKSKEILAKLMDAFGLVSEALENIYDSNFNAIAMDVESEVDTLTYKLESEGLLDSDFERMQKEQNAQ